MHKIDDFKTFHVIEVVPCKDDADFCKYPSWQHRSKYFRIPVLVGVGRFGVFVDPRKRERIPGVGYEINTIKSAEKIQNRLISAREVENNVRLFIIQTQIFGDFPEPRRSEMFSIV